MAARGPLGTLADTSILIRGERAGESPSSFATQANGIAAITASELLHGVHRADPARRLTREHWVEELFQSMLIVPLDLTIGRVHARLWAELSAGGNRIGPHDMLVAATALALGWSLATLNLRDFSRVPGLSLVPLP